ncbi:MAG: NACHT domain-containing protein, partial [Micromonosporaceae bacterium]
MTPGDLTLVAASSSADSSTALIALVGTVLSALIAGGFGFWQLRRSHRFQREMEEQRWEFDTQRMELEAQIDAERRLREEELLAGEQRTQAEAELQARLAEEEANADDLRRRAVAYRRAVIAELRNLKILDMTRPLDLEALYVRVQVREQDPVRYVSEEEVTRLAKGAPEAILAERRAPSAPVEEFAAAISLAPEEALSRFHRIALLGDPGAGKTTLLRHLTFRIARGELVPGALKLPVYVELRRFADSDSSDLVDYVAGEWRDRYGFDGARLYLERELEAGHCALLLDGLDEVLGGMTAEEAEAAHRRVSAEIDRLANRFPIAPIAVTCRRAGWRGKLPAFHTFDVLDFAWREVQIFVDKWFERTPARAEGLRRALATNLRMRTLAANPLLLSLIAIVYERNLELPERRAELYRRCVEVLLQEWDSHREIRRYSDFTTDRKRDLLEEVAWHFHRRGLRYFPEDELLSVVRRFLPTIDIDPQHATAILDEIATQYGLLKVQAHGWYGFLHLSLQEYFTAVAASARSTAAMTEIVQQRHDPWWEEVLLLLAGRTNDASPLLLGILGRHAEDGEPATHEPLAVDDDVLHSDLLLAARCLANTPKIRTPWLRPGIVQATQRLLLDPPDRATQRRAARALAEMRNRGVTDELFALADRDPAANSAVYRAFGHVGDTDTATRLLELLERRTSNGAAAIARALGDLRHRLATPVLLRLLDSDARTTEREAASVVRALG